MQYVVPQFIDVEAKIIGPISARQFIILLVTAGLLYVLYSLFTLVLAIPLMLIVFGSGGVLAFGKVNGQRMHYVLLNLVQTFRRPRLKVWARPDRFIEYDRMTDDDAPAAIPVKAPVTRSRLAEVSLMVDTGGSYNPDQGVDVPAQSDAVTQTDPDAIDLNRQ